MVGYSQFFPDYFGTLCFVYVWKCLTTPTKNMPITLQLSWNFIYIYKSQVTAQPITEILKISYISILDMSGHAWP